MQAVHRDETETGHTGIVWSSLSSWWMATLFLSLLDKQQQITGRQGHGCWHKGHSSVLYLEGRQKLSCLPRHGFCMFDEVQCEYKQRA